MLYYVFFFDLVIRSIFHDEAKKTLLAILGDLWPVGSYTYTDIIEKKPDWMDDVVNEFRVCIYIYTHTHTHTQRTL